MEQNDADALLIELIDRDDTSYIESLLERGANPNITGSRDKTILMWAAERGNVDVLIIAQEAGCDVHARDVFGRTALAYGVQDPNILQLLLSFGADINACDTHGATSLLEAIRSGVVASVGVLLSYGATFDCRALDCAAFYNYSADICKLLIENGADINGATQNGTTPLMAAIEAENIPVVQLLLELGCDLALTNSAGRTAWDLAESKWRRGQSVDSTAIIRLLAAQMRGKTAVLLPEDE